MSISAFFLFKIFKQINNNSFKKKEELDGYNDTLDDIQVPILSKPSQELTSIQDHNYNTLLKKANNAYKENKLETAKDLLRDALEIKQQSDAYNRYAFICVKENNKEDAINYYLKSLSVDPDNDMTHNAIADVYSQIDKLELSRQHYQEALQIDNEYALTHYNYAKLLEKLDNTYEAKEHYTIAKTLDDQLNIPEESTTLEIQKNKI
jgi:tetratricopeptide (TPR) repeat protein